VKPVIWTILLVLGSVAISAAPTNAEIVKFSCNFTKTCTTDGCEPTDFSLDFSVDDQTRFATMVGNVGMVEVKVFVGTQGVNFIEQTDGGTTQSTSISRNGSAVHSRHTFIAGELAASQFYGFCK
jgi:hypothetical protein